MPLFSDRLLTEESCDPRYSRRALGYRNGFPHSGGADRHACAMDYYRLFAEGAALVRVGERREAGYMKQLGGIALLLGTLRLLGVDHFDVRELLLNERMLAFAVAIAATAAVAHRLADAGREGDRIVVAILVVMINVFALAALTEEITDAWRRQLQTAGPGADRTSAIIRDFAYSALWMTYGAGLMLIGFWKKSRFLRWQALILMGATIWKVFLYDTSSLDRGYRILSFIALGLILLATSFLYQRSSRAPRSRGSTAGIS